MTTAASFASWLVDATPDADLTESFPKGTVMVWNQDRELVAGIVRSQVSWSELVLAGAGLYTDCDSLYICTTGELMTLDSPDDVQRPRAVLELTQPTHPCVLVLHVTLTGVEHCAIEPDGVLRPLDNTYRKGDAELMAWLTEGTST